jgi:hypothetical protein
MARNKKTKKKIREEKNKERFNNGITTNSCSSDDNFETFVLIENRLTTNDNATMNPTHQQGTSF